MLLGSTTFKSKTVPSLMTAPKPTNTGNSYTPRMGSINFPTGLPHLALINPRSLPLFQELWRILQFSFMSVLQPSVTTPSRCKYLCLVLRPDSLFFAFLVTPYHICLHLVLFTMKSHHHACRFLDSLNCRGERSKNLIFRRVLETERKLCCNER